MKIIDCHEEKIHLLGKIQNLGWLMIFEEGYCIAYSENVLIKEYTLSQIIGKSFNEIVHYLLPDLKPEMILKSVMDTIFHRFVQRISLHNEDYFVSIYCLNSRIYIETEIAHPERIDTTKLYYYGRYIEDHGHHQTWRSLTEMIREIIGFDRVMVYQFLENDGGKVVAESKLDSKESFLGYRYPEFDIPKQAKELYKIFHARQTADVNSKNYQIVGVATESLDLGHCGIRAMSPIHLQYIRNSGAKASASFSIMIDGELWGLVTCQHYSSRHVDLSQRHLCVFLTQYAVNNYLAGLQKDLISYKGQINVLENKLKTELLLNHREFTVLEKLGSDIMNLMSSDGVIIRHDQGVKQYGEVPFSDVVLKIDDIINQSDYDGIYFTNQLEKENIIQDLGKNQFFPGVIRLDVVPNSNLYVYCFRKERIVDEIWAGKPEKIEEIDTDQGIGFYSPRKSFEAWITKTEGKSEDWKPFEIDFLSGIGNIVQQSLAQRGGAIEELNKELIRSNSALDTFTYTLMHDLRNPLTSIQLSAQLIRSKTEMSDEMKLKMATNIIEGTKLITEMMDKTYKISQVTHVEFEFEIIYPESKILSIIENAIQQYKIPHLQFTVDECLPVWGERTLLYQLFLNLIGNAIKYSSKEAQPAIIINSSYQGDEICYTISDNGIGMDLADKRNIFEIFKRLPNTDGFEGSGIGLSIVKRIADKLNARLSVDSELGVGSSFQVLFKKS